jgi:RNA polymerase sigma factor (sigma-70 family)
MEGAQTKERGTNGNSAKDIAFRAEMIALIPFLRAFARTLSGHRDDADDLCQETLAKAWQSRGAYQMGTNLKAWLFMILRNQFYSDRRRSWRQQPWHDSDAENLQAPSWTLATCRALCACSRTNSARR